MCKLFPVVFVLLKYGRVTSFDILRSLFLSYVSSHVASKKSFVILAVIILLLSMLTLVRMFSFCSEVSLVSLYSWNLAFMNPRKPFPTLPQSLFHHWVGVTAL